VTGIFTRCFMAVKEMKILYEVYDGLYINLTNRCPCACAFCIRKHTDHVGQGNYSLWLEHEPDYDEIVNAFRKVNLNKYSEAVFCGFGEPTEALDMLLETARFIKNGFPELPLRINTNGLGNLINGRDITPLFRGLIDRISISLNTPDEVDYYNLVKPRFGVKSFNAMLDFAEKAKLYVPEVTMTTVETTITKKQEEECRMICGKIGVRYRIRPLE